MHIGNDNQFHISFHVSIYLLKANVCFVCYLYINLKLSVCEELIASYLRIYSGSAKVWRIQFSIYFQIDST